MILLHICVRYCWMFHTFHDDEKSNVLEKIDKTCLKLDLTGAVWELFDRNKRMLAAAQIDFSSVRHDSDITGRKCEAIDGGSEGVKLHYQKTWSQFERMRVLRQSDLITLRVTFNFRNRKKRKCPQHSMLQDSVLNISFPHVARLPIQISRSRRQINNDASISSLKPLWLALRREISSSRAARDCLANKSKRTLWTWAICQQ